MAATVIGIGASLAAAVIALPVVAVGLVVGAGVVGVAANVNNDREKK